MSEAQQHSNQHMTKKTALNETINNYQLSRSAHISNCDMVNFKLMTKFTSYITVGSNNI